MNELKNLIANGTGKKEDPILQRIDALQSELKAEKEKAAKKEMDDFKSSMKDDLMDIQDRIMALSASPKKTENEIDEIIRLQKRRKDIIEALGLPSERKDEEAGIGDVIDMITDKGPKVAKTFSTIRDAWKGNDELTDDLPENIPTNLPERTRPQTARSPVPDDIKKFINSGHDVDGTYIDAAGTAWKNKITGEPISKHDIEDLAIVDPDQLRSIMKDTYADIETQRKARAEAREKQTPDAPTHEPTPKPAAESTPKPIEQPAHEEPDDIPASEPATQQVDHLKEALDYINSGEDKIDEKGTTQWVGKQSEIYSGEEDNPLTKEGLIAEATKDPETFMRDVKAHLKTLE